MHHIYTTKTFIITSTPHGEAGKFLLLFTEDFGLIGATAQGVRLINSKLRYHLQDSSFSNVSVVRGKEVWRVTGAVEISHEKPTIIHLKILKLLRRFLHGEEKNEELFKIVEELYRNTIKEEDEEFVECLTVLRILNNLGYVNNTEQTSIFLENNLISEDLINEIKKNKAEMVKVINKALTESQL